MPAPTTTLGIHAPDKAEKRDEILELLQAANWMELETVMSYIADSVGPDGVRAQEIKEALEADIGGARPRSEFANRIKELYGVVQARWSPRGEVVSPAAEEQTDIAT